ncbi:phage tail spike protein [Macrococcus capreoli]|uniref:phage tail spike protein n=1 Tax=Macrococcus capreoli TaxID=2982690 RepID=UPI003EE722D4
MIYLFDVYKQLKHTIPSSQIVSATYTQELNALYTFDSELPLIYKDAKTGEDINLKTKFEACNYVGHFDNKGKFHLYKVYTIKVDGDMLIVKGVHIFFDEAKSMKVIEDVRLVDLDARDMFNNAFSGTGWSVKNFDNTAITSQDFYKVVPLEARAIIIEKFKVEIHPYLEFDGQQITGRFVDIRKKLGNEKGQRFAYGHNAFNVTHEQNRAEIYTAVIGRGATNGLNNVKETRVEYHNIEWKKSNGKPADKPLGSNVLELPDRTQEYGHIMSDGTLKPRIGYVNFDDITDASILLDETYKWLNENSRPKFIAESTVEQIGSAELGDTINFIYKEIDLYFSVRIFKVVYDLLDDLNTSVELGDYGFFNTDKSAQRVQGEIKRVENLATTYIEQQKTIFDDEFERVRNEFNDKLNQAELEALQQVQVAETRMTNELTSQREALSTDINTSYANATKYADDKANALKTEVSNDINTAKTNLSNDINTSYTNATKYADTKASELQTKVATDINNAKTSLSTDITTSYNNAVTQAQAKVDTAKTALTQTMNANKQDADNKISTLNTALGDATKRMDATDVRVNGLVGDIGTLNNQFTDINGQLVPIKSDILKNSGDISSVKNTVAGHTTDISTLNNQITLKATKTELTDAIGGLTFENRNLLEKSATMNKDIDKTWGSYVQLHQIDITSVSSKVAIGDVITVSFDIQMTTGTIFQIYDSNGQINVSLGQKTWNNIGTTKQRLSYTTTLKAPTRTPGSAWTLTFYNTNNGDKFTIDNIKIEKGAKATPYSQAPEDLEGKITKNTADIVINAEEIAKRVLKTDFDSKTGQMQTQINTATSTANENKQTIAIINGDIDKIEEWQIAKGTTIQQTADAINQKIWNTDINTATGAINNRLNTVSSTVDGNSQTILQHTSQINGLTTWQTEKGAIINQTQSAINQKVWQTDITGAIDNLDYGTRNLFVNNTAQKDKCLVWSTGALNAEIGSVTSDFIEVSANDTILSNYATSQLLYYDDKGWMLDIGGNKNGGNKFTIHNDSRIKYMKVSYRSNFLNGQTIADKKVMIVKGTKMGDYQPAIEDTDARISKAEADINVNANAITQRVLKTDFDSKTGQMQTQINTVTSTANNNSSLITTVKGTVDSLNLWKTQKGTLIDQTIDSVSQKVWQNDIDALSYDNRNLLINSKNAKLSQNNVGLGNAVQNTDKSWTITPDAGKAVSVYKFLTGGAMSIPNFASGTNYIIGLDVIADRDCRLTKYVSNTTYNSPQVDLKANVKQRVYVDLIIGTGSTSSALILMLNTADAKLTYDNIKVEQGTKATPYSVAPEDAENKMSEISQTADSAKLQADTVAKDYVKQSAVIVQSDGVMIGSKKVSGTEMASAISVTPSNVDIITRVMRVTGDMQVAGDIQTLSINAVNANIASIRTNMLTADSVTSTALKVDTALINKLNTNAILTNYLTADTAMINAIKTNAVTAVRADIAWLKANVITADSITSTNLKVDQALIDKLNTNAILTNMLVADTAMINAIKANALVAVHADIAWLKANVITADSITSTALKVDQALIDKLNVSSLLVNKVIADTAYVNSVKSLSVTAVRGDIAYLKSNIITADSIDATALKVDVSMINKLFAQDAYITTLTSKAAFISSVKALDIEAIRLRAVDNKAAVNIENGMMTINRTDGYKMQVGIDGVSMYNADGSRRFTVNRFTVESSALSTSNSNVYLATDAGYEARVVDRTALPGDGLVGSYTYRPMRALSYHFGYLANGYIGIGGDELRVMSDGLAADNIYRDVRANYYLGEVLESNKSTNLYIRPNGGEVRFTQKGTTDNYQDFRGNIGYINGISANSTDTNLYIGMDGELRVTSRGLGTVSGGPVYRAVRAQAFNLSSLADYKENINIWDYDALSVLSDHTKIYQYQFKNDESKRIRRGLVIGDEYDTPVEFINEDGVDSYEMISWSIRAIQQLNEKIKKLEALQNE